MLEAKDLSKTYVRDGRSFSAIRNVSLRVEDGQCIALLGPSGCGKSTFLKIAAGLLESTTGHILLDGEKIIGPNQDRGMIFQNYSLFPWLTVRENIGFGEALQGISQAEKTKTIEHYLHITGLTQFADFYPKDLSGGMQQKAAIGRTLANDPKVLLMDEPFGSLDAQTRSHMQEFLAKLCESDQKTIIFVTHDINEAAFLADKIYILSKRPMQIKKIYDVPFARPRTRALKHTSEFFKFTNKVTRALEA